MPRLLFFNNLRGYSFFPFTLSIKAIIPAIIRPIKQAAPHIYNPYVFYFIILYMGI